MIDNTTADESAISVMQYLHNASIKISISPLGVATINAIVGGYQGITSTIDVSVYLQKYVDGGWQNMPGANWSETFRYLHGCFAVAHQVTSGHLYRGYAIINAHCGDLCEAQSFVSNVQFYWR